MEAEEALRLAKEEGLHLPPGRDGSRFKYVVITLSGVRPYKAEPYCPKSKKAVYRGCFTTAEEAALESARYVKRVGAEVASDSTTAAPAPVKSVQKTGNRYAFLRTLKHYAASSVPAPSFA